MGIPSKTRLFIDSLKSGPSNGNRPLFLNEKGAIEAKWNNLTLSSVFQPIYKSNELTKAFAYEAFVRCEDANGNQIGVNDLFSKNANQDEITGLDRLCRTLHLLNFTLHDEEHALLFLNVNEGLISAVGENHGAAFRKVIDALGFSPSRIVIELPISLVKDSKRLHFVLQNYRLNSLEVAVNIEAKDDLASLAERVNIHYIKIARSSLQAQGNLNTELEKISQLSDSANIIITKNDAPLQETASPNLMLQGNAYRIASGFQENALTDASTTSLRPFISLHVGG